MSSDERKYVDIYNSRNMCAATTQTNKLNLTGVVLAYTLNSILCVLYVYIHADTVSEIDGEDVKSASEFVHYYYYR